MATIFTSDFEGADNAAIPEGGANFFTNVGPVGTGTITYETSLKTKNTSSMKADQTGGTGNTAGARKDLATGSSVMWLDTYVRVEKAPSNGSAISVVAWYYRQNAVDTSPAYMTLQIEGVAAGSTKFRFKLRNGFSTTGVTSSGVTPDLNVGEWYRIALKTQPGLTGNNPSTDAAAGIVLYVYSGANRDTMTPTHVLRGPCSAALTTITGAQTIAPTAFTGGPINSLRLGLTNADGGTTPIGGTVLFDDLIVNDATQPQRAPASTAIPEWTEDFEDSGSPVGTTLLPANSFVTGTLAGADVQPTFFGDQYFGSKGCQFLTGTGQWSLIPVQKSDEAAPVWIKFRYKPQVVPAISSAIFSLYLGTIKVMDVRSVYVNATTYQLQLRDDNTERFLSSNITAQTYIEVAVQVRPNINTAGAATTGIGSMKMRYYTGTGTERRGTTTATQDSGYVVMSSATTTEVAATRPAVTAVDTIRFGSTNGTVADVRFDAFAADRGSEPPGIAPPQSTLSVTVPDISNLEPYSSFQLNPVITGGTTPYTYAWTKSASAPTLSSTSAFNPTATLTGAHALPAGTSFTYTLTVNGTTSDTATVTVLPHTTFNRNTTNTGWGPVVSNSYSNVGAWE